MESITDLFSHFFRNIDKYAIGASLLATTAGATASIGAKSISTWLAHRPLGRELEVAVLRGRDLHQAAGAYDKGQATTDLTTITSWKTRDSAAVLLPKTPSQVAREQVVIRLNEAKTAMTEQRGAAKVAKISSNLLTIGQFIVGGVLASSFVQEALTPKWVGGLGVLVLVASLFKQQFHPELNAEEARKKSSRLQALIRFSEDQLAIIDAKMTSGQDHSDAMISLMTQITQTLTEIENPEALESSSKSKNK